MTLRDQMEADVSTVFLNTDEHAEDITYIAKGYPPRTIKAIVDEDGSLVDGSGQMVSRGVAMLFVLRSTDGISNPSVGDVVRFDRNGFTLELAYSGLFRDADAFGWWLEFNLTTIKRFGSNAGPQ